MRPELSQYNHVSAGKVREIYEIDDDTLLMVVSDRISAYDHILDPEIPDKGRVLTAMSMYFFDHIDFPNHLAGDIDDMRIPEEVLGRAIVCKKLKMLPFECVVRGYLTGSGYKEYLATGSVCGIPLPEGLVESSKLPEPIFTPATKADLGDHDENVTFEQVVEKLGERRATELRDASINIYKQAAELAEAKGITRSQAGIRLAVEEHPDALFAVGNAPTAIIELCELIRRGKAQPQGIIAAPVGFVNVRESKYMAKVFKDIPKIIVEGRKGGSNLAATLVNSVLTLDDAEALRPGRDV